MIPIQPVSLLFDNALHRNGVALLFERPIEEIVAWEASDVRPALLAADRFIGTGRFVAGYLSYEAGYALEPKLVPLTRVSLWPLLRLFVFPRPRVLAPAERDTYLQRCSGEAEISIDTGALHEAWHAGAFDRVRRAILDGEVYQLNLTFPLSVRTSGHPAHLYPPYRTQARAGASALLSMGEETILSFSPETFFTRQRTVIRTRPMKGTAPRGLTFAQDRAQRRGLRADPKERAENLMIVDLLRNDISRLGLPGRTEVTDLFTVETFPRLHTMTSGVQGELDPDTPLSAILTALFPCGSVTGAPKVRAMELIHAIEPVARGPYCGAIGFAGPGIAAFNVAIRTLQFRGQTGVMGVGSGIVADSRAREEFQECLLKARFLTAPVRPLTLLDTALWTRSGGLSLSEAHVQRLEESADYFGMSFEPLAYHAVMEAAAKAAASDAQRLRFLLEADGRHWAEAAPVSMTPDVWRYIVSDQQIDAAQVHFHHKTTQRDIYDRALANATRAWGADEVVFFNTQGELAEGARSTIFLELNGETVTPPPSSGALDGALRRAFLDALPTGAVVERPISRTDFDDADAVWFANALRGFVKGSPIEQ